MSAPHCSHSRPRALWTWPHVGQLRSAWARAAATSSWTRRRADSHGSSGGWAGACSPGGRPELIYRLYRGVLLGRCPAGERRAVTGRSPLLQDLDPQRGGPDAGHFDDPVPLQRGSAQPLDGLELLQLAAPQLATLQRRAAQVGAAEVAAVEHDGVELGLQELRASHHAVLEADARQAREAERRHVELAAGEREVLQRPLGQLDAGEAAALERHAREGGAVRAHVGEVAVGELPVRDAQLRERRAEEVGAVERGLDVGAAWLERGRAAVLEPRRKARRLGRGGGLQPSASSGRRSSARTASSHCAGAPSPSIFSSSSTMRSERQSTASRSSEEVSISAWWSNTFSSTLTWRRSARSSNLGSSPRRATKRLTRRPPRGARAASGSRSRMSVSRSSASSWRMTASATMRRSVRQASSRSAARRASSTSSSTTTTTALTASPRRSSAGASADGRWWRRLNSFTLLRLYRREAAIVIAPAPQRAACTDENRLLPVVRGVHAARAARAGPPGRAPRLPRAVDLRPLPPVDRGAGRVGVRVVGHRRAGRGDRAPSGDYGRDLPDGADPPRDHRPGGGHLRRDAGGPLRARRRQRRGA